METQSTPPEFATAFAAQRQRILHRTSRVLGDIAPEPAEGKTDEGVVPKLAGLLGASLEELKVAEEEMYQQHEELESTRLELERQLAHYRVLFDMAPAALVLTDSYGCIHELNRAAAALLHRDAYYLMRKPLTALVPRGERGEFRDGLSRLTLTAGVANWRFTLERPTDAPIEVSAAVQVVPYPSTGTALLWRFDQVAMGEIK